MMKPDPSTTKSITQSGDQTPDVQGGPVSCPTLPERKRTSQKAAARVMYDKARAYYDPLK